MSALWPEPRCTGSLCVGRPRVPVACPLAMQKRGCCDADRDGNGDGNGGLFAEPAAQSPVRERPAGH